MAVSKSKAEELVVALFVELELLAAAPRADSNGLRPRQIASANCLLPPRMALSPYPKTLPSWVIV